MDIFKKTLSSAVICLALVSHGNTASTVTANSTVVAKNSNRVPCTGKKKFRFGFELGARTRYDRYEVSAKTDVEEKMITLIRSSVNINDTITQEDLNTTMGQILDELPGLQDTIKGLTEQQKTEIAKNYRKLLDLNLQKGKSLTNGDIAEPVNAICATLGITHNGQPNVWAAYHDPKYLLIQFAAMEKPDLIKRNLTVAEVNSALGDLGVQIYKGITSALDTDSTIKGKEHLNWDLFANLFMNYYLSDGIYLIAGVGGSYDLGGSKGRAFKASEGQLSSAAKAVASANKDQNGDESTRYSIKYAITPRIGVGVDCSKHFAIEISAFDQITKVEYDCSSMYKSSTNDLSNTKPGITDIFPDKKQSNWVNRFGAELGLMVNINERFFAKLGVFYLFPTNIFKKIKPFDLKIQSIGASLSLGMVF